MIGSSVTTGAVWVQSRPPPRKWRIRAEMEKIKDEVGFKGDLKAFFADLRSNPKFFYRTPEDLFTAYQAISK